MRKRQEGGMEGGMEWEAYTNRPGEHDTNGPGEIRMAERCSGILIMYQKGCGCVK